MHVQPSVVTISVLYSSKQAMYSIEPPSPKGRRGVNTMRKATMNELCGRCGASGVSMHASLSCLETPQTTCKACRGMNAAPRS